MANRVIAFLRQLLPAVTQPSGNRRIVSIAVKVLNNDASSLSNAALIVAS
ncbi:hypothetical protein [Nocardia sp. 348MFTsu5.1]|nr:hypothetical protein [Nocardia sp. 348MFTsu5.1]